MKTETYQRAETMKADLWIPACGGTETPAKARDGRTYLYCWNAAREQHGWLDLGTDIVTLEDPNDPCHPDDGCTCCW